MTTTLLPDPRAALRSSRPPRPRESPIPEPWKRSWLYRAPGDTATLGWVVMLHVATVAGLILLPFPGWPVVAVSIGLAVLGGLGTTICYHRAHAHRGVKLHPIADHALVFFAMFNGSGTPRTWVANHRLHHATSDTEEDISAPARGFWWAHLRWLWQAGQAPSARYCPDLDRPGYRVWGRLQVPVLAVSFFGGLLISPAAWLWLGPLRLLWSLHGQCTVNSICHLGEPAERGGSSRNVWWLAPFLLLQGENWHRNHHEEPANPRLGRGAAQVDLGWWSVVVLQRLGLARVRRGAESTSPN